MKKKNKKLEETHPLTWRLREDQKTVFINEYLKKNGYAGLKKAISKFSPDEIIKKVINSELKGRGGAGFPTGMKWELMKKSNNINTKYERFLICNADEMEPGTYKDKLLMEKNPHLLIEGIILSSYALNVPTSYIFLRGEYTESNYFLNIAIKEATREGFLGKKILGSNFNLNIFIHTGAGRYICGEETALINSLEGKRANPRFKPPFPANIGLWGKPTCVNNVETLCNIPAIILHGTTWYKKLSKTKDHGTKMMGFSGKVNKPGVWELPFGITARELLEDYAQGMQNNLKLKAWLPGGAGTDFLTYKHLDIPIDFTNINIAGSRLGTAISIAIDEKTNIVPLLINLEDFFSRESCGWCTPCREGLPWSLKILKKIESGLGNIEDIKVLDKICTDLSPGKTFCAHAPGAVSPLKSAIKYFISDFKKYFI
ncbi:NADH-quinone oxidoreductase subunit NuoF [Buchnera aphidicola]|uniref:NADH-quinone oxidoreductase subunit F n=1 Tax=Buchnera aphidicola (Anoecia oenotherae) TaxID=1241833 RepID=A0A4D6Y081_9GAMM|nr:NADH-quinone oxidoreductase subunit NuoF [Buchnera aphidicola]QCI19261.1 NADH oxidoreductase (quinone) subunit F [Buchnera aphidicola (Anoecia oenotherae)]